MPKRIKKILRDIILILILGSIVRVLLIDSKMIITENIIPLQNTYHASYYEGEYYYFDKSDKKTKSGIYKLSKEKNELIYQTNEVNALAVNGDYLFIAENNKIIKVSKRKKGILASNECETDKISNFYLSENHLFFENTGIKVLEINNFSRIKTYNGMLIDDIILFCKFNSNIYKINNNNGLLLTDESNLTTPNIQIMQFDESKGYFYFTLMFINGALYIHRYPEIDEINIIYYDGNYTYRKGNLFLYDNKLLIVKQLYEENVSFTNSIYEFVRNFIKNPKEFMSCAAEHSCYIEEMYMHTSDYVDILENGTWKKVNGCKTEKGERIIYADGKKIITCKNKNYTEYNMKDFSINKKWRNNYITNKGIYHFELCMNKIFVYNEDFKLLDVIDVK